MNLKFILVSIILVTFTPMKVASVQIQAQPKPIVYDTLLERILAQSTDFFLLTYARNQLRNSCGTNCNYTWRKEESFGLKDPLTGCQVYIGLSKRDTEKVSKQIEKIFFSDQPRLIKTSVTRQFIHGYLYIISILIFQNSSSSLTTEICHLCYTCYAPVCPGSGITSLATLYNVNFTGTSSGVNIESCSKIET